MECEMLLYLSFDQRHWNAHFKTISIIVFFYDIIGEYTEQRRTIQVLNVQSSFILLVSCRSFSCFLQENDLRKALIPFFGIRKKMINNKKLL